MLSHLRARRAARTSGDGPDPSRLVRLFLGWIFVRAVLHHGWWLLASLYMVVDAGLRPAELLVLAAAQGVAAVVFELPAGVFADSVSRTGAIVISHGLMGAAMITTGLFPSFVPLLLSQMLWGIAWTFSSGSDVAWITDELDEPGRMHRVLTRSARWQLTGAGGGMVALGSLATVVGRQPVILGAGIAMLALGALVAFTFPERNFTPLRSGRWHGSLRILRGGMRLALRDRTILVLVVVTVLVNGAGDSFGRILPVRLVDVGLPTGSTGTLWFTAISIGGLLTGVLALRAVERRIDSERGARGAMVLAGVAGALSIGVFGLAPNLTVAVVALLVASGVAMPIVRTVTTIWVNRRATSEVRATVHSVLAQAEYVGEIATAGVLAALAGATGAAGAFLLAATLFGVSALVVLAAGRES